MDRSGTHRFPDTTGEYQVSTKQNKPAPINVPSFAPSLNRITKAIVTAETKVDNIRANATETVAGIF